MAKQSKTKKSSIAVFIGIVAILFALVTTTYSTVKSNLNLGLDLQGGFEILYQVKPLNGDSSIDMDAVVNSISKRINVLGVSEPSISVEGNDRVRVQLAGVTDQDAAREMIGTTANLTFRDVDDNELADSSILTEGGASLAYNENGQPIVSLKIKDQKKFAEMTKEVSKKTKGSNIMVIWLDYEEGYSYKTEAAKAAKGEEPKYISAASVNSEISGDCQISGNFTEEEARELANLINSGSLPVKMTELSSNVVSAQFGQDALAKTALAGGIGVALVMLFMIVKYRLPGIVSAIMLVAYIWGVFGLYSLMGAVFTLSGIGALVLGVGMTVDVNIIDFERIRQELYKGRSVPNAVREGQTVSFSAIFDSQFTTFLTALIMYIWGNGSVKGFATMLIITVIMTMLLNVALSRIMLKLIVNSHIADNHPEWFAVKKEQIPDVSKGQSQFYTGTHQFDYVQKSKLVIRAALAVFALALCLGIFNVTKGNGFVKLGIDFASGTKLTITSDNALTTDEVKNEMETLGYKGFAYQAAGENSVYATTTQTFSTEELTKLKTALKDVYGQEPNDNVVTPVVGKDLVRNAIILTVVAWVAMLAYITIRYQWDYAVGCLVALFHDVFMVLALFMIARYEINTELISVLLTIIGYSINNSIIVFDRIRETMESKKGSLSKEQYAEVVNSSLDKTIKMSFYGSITTLFPVIFLLAMGSNAIFTFNFAMLIGLVAGTFSSLFIAPSVWIYLRTHTKHKDKPKKKKKQNKEELDEYTFKGINA